MHRRTQLSPQDEKKIAYGLSNLPLSILAIDPTVIFILIVLLSWAGLGLLLEFLEASFLLGELGVVGRLFFDEPVQGGRADREGA